MWPFLFSMSWYFRPEDKMESEDYDDQEAKEQLSDQKQTARKKSKRTSTETIIKDQKHKASPRKPKHSKDNNTKSKKKKSQEIVRQKTQLNITLPNASRSTNDDSRPTSQYSVDDESKGQHSKDSIETDGSEKDRNADELNTDMNENTSESIGKLLEYDKQLSKKEQEVDPLEANTDDDSKQDHLNNASNNTDKEQDVYEAESDSNEGVNQEAKGDKCKEEEVTFKPVKETKVTPDNNFKTREPENITLYIRDPKSNNNSKKKQSTETKNNLHKDESKKGKANKKKKDKLVTNKNEVLDRKKEKSGESSTELQVSEPKQQKERPKTADVGIQCGTNDPNDEVSEIIDLR